MEIVRILPTFDFDLCNKFRKLIYDLPGYTDLVFEQGLLSMVGFPAIFGHEGAGIIRAIGKGVQDKELQVRSPALLSFNTCDTCEPCKGDHPALC